LQKLAVVILNWNGRNHLEEFLPSVVKHSADFEIVLVDNASTDDSVSFLKGNYPEIKLVFNTENGGFAKGYNEGLEQIKDQYEYYVLLNSDVEVTENWISPVLSLLESDESIAGCQPKVLSYKRKNFFEHAGAAGGFIDKNGYPFCRGRIFSEVEEDKGQYNTTTEIFWATGACMFVRANKFHELGGFDADYFAHMEEIDLCWRMKINGLKLFYCAESTVYHLGGGTLDYMSPRKVYLNFRNSLYTLYKNYQGKYLFFKIFWRTTLDYIAFWMFVFKFDFKSAKEVMRAQIHFIKHIKQSKAKRKQIKSTSTTYNETGVFDKSIVFSFFLFGKKKFSDLDSNKIH
jgi:GT2 family glycosyltransferase